MSYLLTPAGTVVNLAAFATIAAPAFTNNNNPHGEYAVRGILTAAQPSIVLFQGNAEEAGAFFAKVRQALIPETMSGETGNETEKALRSLLQWTLGKIDSEVTSRPEVNQFKEMLSATWNQFRTQIELRLCVATGSLDKKPGIVVYCGDGKLLSPQELSDVTSALALHRSMAESGESPSIHSWTAYLRAMHALGNKYAISYAEERIREHTDAIKGVRIIRSGFLSGTDCPQRISREILSKHGVHPEPTCRDIDGWRLYDTLNPPPAAHMSKNSTEDARTVAEFLRGVVGLDTPAEAQNAGAKADAMPLVEIRQSGESPPRFPIQSHTLSTSYLRKLCPKFIPWLSIAPYDAKAYVHHGQSLDRLAERGGLSPQETWTVMNGGSSHLAPREAISEEDAVNFLLQIVKGPNPGAYAAEKVAENAKQAKAAEEQAGLNNPTWRKAHGLDENCAQCNVSNGTFCVRCSNDLNRGKLE